MTTKQFVLAHDLGTTGNKATLYNATGALVASTFDGYTVDYPHPNWAEQNPEDWWNAVCTSSRRLIAESGIAPSAVACVVFSGQMQGCVALDADANPLRSAIIWADQRAVEQTAWVAEQIPPETIYAITGHRLSPAYTLGKMLWLRDHQPDIYAAAHKFVHAKDFIVARMTGQFVTDVSDATGMNLYDLERGTWSAQILDATGIDAAQLPDVRLSTDVVGEVLPAPAEAMGIAAGTPVVIGAGDGACAAAGASVVQAGSAYNYVGSSAWIAMASESPISDPDRRTFTFGHLVPGMFMPIGTMQAAGASYQWMRDQLCGVEVQSAVNLHISPYDLMNLQAEQSPPGANGLLYLPYLLGERSPRWNHLARGAFIGLSIRHTRADMIRAVLEGITFNLRVILDAFTAQGAQIDTMRLIGGGARGRLWNRIMADIYGIPVQRLAILEEATSMGAALAGGVGVGLYPGFEMIERMNRVTATITPDATNHTRYNALYPTFEAAYHALVPIYSQLAQFNQQEA
jgi:xylulokinase